MSGGQPGRRVRVACVPGREAPAWPRDWGAEPDGRWLEVESWRLEALGPPISPIACCCGVAARAACRGTQRRGGGGLEGHWKRPSAEDIQRPGRGPYLLLAPPWSLEAAVQQGDGVNAGEAAGEQKSGGETGGVRRGEEQRCDQASEGESGERGRRERWEETFVEPETGA